MHMPFGDSRYNLAAFLCALLVAFVVLFSGTGKHASQGVAVSAASSTIEVSNLSQLSFPSLPTATTTLAFTLAPAPPVATTTKPAPAKAVIKAKPVTPAATSSAPVIPLPSGDISVAASTLRAALVNIICLVPSGSGLQSISGSGVIISPSGYILTNSHVAQYFLLKDRDVSCGVRTGSPASSAYRAGLAYISPAWINANSNVLSEQAPTGTGEYDFAILAITGSTSGNPVPASFPYAPLATDPPQAGEPVVIGAYPAQFLETSAIESSLYQTVVYGSIKDVYTFTQNLIDVVSLGGTAAAQEGSSGGGVIDASGKLTATVTTSTTAGDTADRNLDAITANYIRREYQNETGDSLDDLLALDPFTAIRNFAPRIPSLEAIITAPLNQNQ